MDNVNVTQEIMDINFNVYQVVHNITFQIPIINVN